MGETQVLSPSREDPLEKGMTILSSILAWRIPRKEVENKSLTEKRRNACSHSTWEKSQRWEEDFPPRPLCLQQFRLTVGYLLYSYQRRGDQKDLVSPSY